MGDRALSVQKILEKWKCRAVSCLFESMSPFVWLKGILLPHCTKQHRMTFYHLDWTSVKWFSLIFMHICLSLWYILLTNIFFQPCHSSYISVWKDTTHSWMKLVEHYFLKCQSKWLPNPWVQHFPGKKKKKKSKPSAVELQMTKLTRPWGQRGMHLGCTFFLICRKIELFSTSNSVIKLSGRCYLPESLFNYLRDAPITRSSQRENHCWPVFSWCPSLSVSQDFLSSVRGSQPSPKLMRIN